MTEGLKESPTKYVIDIDVDPPSANTYYRNFRGRMVLSPKGRSFKKEMAKRCEGKPKILGPVIVRLKFRFRDKRKRDIDNYFKGILDAFKDRLFEDDSLITEIHATKEIGCNSNSGFTMEICEMTH